MLLKDYYYKNFVKKRNVSWAAHLEKLQIRSLSIVTFSGDF